MGTAPKTHLEGVGASEKRPCLLAIWRDEGRGLDNAGVPSGLHGCPLKASPGDSALQPKWGWNPSLLLCFKEHFWHFVKFPTEKTILAAPSFHSILGFRSCFSSCFVKVFTLSCSPSFSQPHHLHTLTHAHAHTLACGSAGTNELWTNSPRIHNSKGV